ncbi:MAG: hypothetical protein EA402_00800 [Planctomycetota bacterium]|nr:MAG: hypothetical protein EA402_00800 [Planctomycetota bacterium]
MHLHFIYPRWDKLLEAQPSLLDTLSAHEVGALRMTSLGLPTAMGALPEGITTSFVDDHDEDACAPLKHAPDAICLGFFTPQATRAYAIADHWRGQGIPVIAGGIHPSAIPEDVAPHADAVVCGPVEGLWPQILADLRRQRLAPRYQQDPVALFAQPRREIFAGKKTLRIDVLQTARGCDRHCAFCVVPTVNGCRIQRKAVAQVIEDCAHTQHPAVFLADENLLHDDPADVAWAEQFHDALERQRIGKFFTAAVYPQVLKTLNNSRGHRWQQAGLRQLYLICGYKAALARELNDPLLRQAIRELETMGISVLVTFTLGHDQDVVDVDDLVGDFWHDTGAHLGEVTISVPFPGTPRFAQLIKEDRLLHRHWQRYNGAFCVFKPRHGSAQAVEACSLRLWRALYGSQSRYQVQQSYVRGFGRDILR